MENAAGRSSPGLAHGAAIGRLVDARRVVRAGGGRRLAAGRPDQPADARVFSWFNAASGRRPAATPARVGMLLRVSVLVLVVYGGLLGLTYWNFMHTPKGFIPTQDMGYLMAAVQLPDSASVERTRAVTDRLQEIVHEHAGRQAHGGPVAGRRSSFSANASNFGSMFVILDDFSKREKPSLSAERDRRRR